MSKNTNIRYTIETIREIAKANEIELLSTEYKSCKHKLKFKCSCGTIFETTLDKVVNRGKTKCTDCLKKPIHDRYRFSNEQVSQIIQSKGCEWISGEYITATSPLLIKCNECGDSYTKTLNSFSNNSHKGRCLKCARKHTNDGTRFSNEAVKQYIELLGCEWISGEYTGNTSRLLIKCHCGELFETSLANMRSNSHKKTSCEPCARKESLDRARHSKEYIHKIMETYDCEWISGEYKNYQSFLTIKCPCGNHFKTSLSSFISPEKRKRRCDSCTLEKSHGESEIERYLEMTGINHIFQFRIDDCRNKKPLPFDFAAFDRKGSLMALIEFDGKQHFEPIEYFGGEDMFERLKENDSIKTNYCNENGIKLIRIPYYEISNVEEILEKELIN